MLPERAVKLNASGREILDLCDGALRCEEIAATLRTRHPQIPDLESDVHDFIGHMRRLGVLDVLP